MLADLILGVGVLLGQGLRSSIHSIGVVCQLLLQLCLAGSLGFAPLAVDAQGVVPHLGHQQLLGRLAQVDRLLLPPPVGSCTGQ